MGDKVEIYPTIMYEVYDPWTAQILAYCFRKEDAKALRKAVRKRKKRRGDNFA